MGGDYTQSNVTRRDFRNSRDEPEVPKHRRKGRGKKLCKKSSDGKHTMVKVENAFFTILEEWRCSTCGHKDIRMIPAKVVN